jgi:hypothetical protein
MLLSEGKFDWVDEGQYTMFLSVWLDGIGKWTYVKIRLTDLMFGEQRIWKWDSSRVATVCMLETIGALVFAFARVFVEFVV